MNDSMMDKPATKQDIENLRLELTDKLASKEELKKLATKEEINKLATKEELKKLATKEEINKLATKEELKKLELTTKKEFKKQDKKIDNLAQVIVQMKFDMTLLETKADADKKFNILLNAIDGLAKNVVDFQTEMRSGERTFQRHEAKLENHEKRLESLEMNALS